MLILLRSRVTGEQDKKVSVHRETCRPQGSSRTVKVYLASKGAIQPQRVLTRTECETEAAVMVRLWRVGGVLSRGMEDKFSGREFGVA